eukprot:TRINITY_DN55001_c0_g1_i1.p1 TRINITY_DN55001_c0_g1~~TRINITY_DN55001_c0_g1_i1.p1  ORF type:complete len:257 (+),score=35.20 TRINITY_DN55001_c0_g1_i1:58-828(+)
MAMKGMRQLAVEEAVQPPNHAASALHIWGQEGGRAAAESTRALAYAKAQAEIATSAARETQHVLDDIMTFVAKEKGECVEPFFGASAGAVAKSAAMPLFILSPPWLERWLASPHEERIGRRLRSAQRRGTKEGAVATIAAPLADETVAPATASSLAIAACAKSAASAVAVQAASSCFFCGRAVGACSVNQCIGNCARACRIVYSSVDDDCSEVDGAVIASDYFRNAGLRNGALLSDQRLGRCRGSDRLKRTPRPFL